MWVVTWGFLLRLVGCSLAGVGGWRWDLAEGMLRSRAGQESCAAWLRVPVTRVFSRYVVQAGSA